MPRGLLFLGRTLSAQRFSRVGEDFESPEDVRCVAFVERSLGGVCEILSGGADLEFWFWREDWC